MNKLIQHLYSWAWRLLLPLARVYLKKRAKQTPAYLQHWGERFGWAFNPQAKHPIWIHAVSVGETRATLPLIQALRQIWPNVPLLLTQMTPTGRTTAQQLYPDAEIRYLPYDYPQAVRGFLQAYQPQFGILMETELWPNLIHCAHEQHIPLFLANARLSDKSLRGYLKVKRLIGPALAKLTAIAAQSAEDSQRLRRLGNCQIAVCGNLKYDIIPPTDLLARFSSGWIAPAGRPVWACVSTREGEEALILTAWQQLLTQTKNALLILVPRHPERFDAVETLIKKHNLRLQRRSDKQPVRADTQVWLGDSMGEAFAYYGCADIAFVGGSLLPFGCHSLIEPISAGIPVLIGPSIFNFQQAATFALQEGVAIQVQNATALVNNAITLLNNPQRRQHMHKAALAFSAKHTGASQRMVTWFKQHLNSTIKAT